MSLPTRFSWCFACLYLLTIPPLLSAADPAIEFFERSIRPILAENCLGCHNAIKQKGDLRLDSREAMLTGGDSGPALIVGKPNESRIIEAMRYQGDTKMPPRGKIADDAIAKMAKWIETGAIWPKEAIAKSETKSIDVLSDPIRRNHWSFQPIRRPELPKVARADWPLNPIDRLILAKLEAAKLAPSADADRATILRRLSFTLTGLPPTPEQLHQFQSDLSANAIDKQIDLMLENPAYGERWARHWLDLVRYAETHGHEFDFNIPEAWRYRDYVIRAIQQDLPYDRFLTEHLAGDLIMNPRRNPKDHSNESILASGFWFLGEAKHSPVDIRQDEDDRIDNQVDVFSKSFLGLTLACARCHDHKFDPIPTRDYYALTGILQSSRFQLAPIDDPTKIQQQRREIQQRLTTLEKTLPGLSAQRWKSLQQAAQSRELSALARLFEIMDQDQSLAATTMAFGSVRSQVEQANAEWERWKKQSIVIADFRTQDYSGWNVTGEAFGQAPTRQAQARIPTIPRGSSLDSSRIGWADGGTVGRKFEGELRSPTFEIQKNALHFRVSGTASKINFIIDGFRLIQYPIYGGLTLNVNHGDKPRWLSMDVAMWKGHRGYIEILDEQNGTIAIEQIVNSDQSPPPSIEPSQPLIQWFKTPSLDRESITKSFQNWCDTPTTCEIPEFQELIHLSKTQLASDLKANPSAAISNSISEIVKLQNQVTVSRRALAMLDGTPENDRVHIRGSHKSMGAEVPRRSLEIFNGPNAITTTGSGRLELAQSLVQPANPLVARVIVNRVWHHHFGVGLVPSTDDFGIQGQKPSHPELLDFLADWFVREGWSLKKLHRLILTSHTYRMSSVSHDPATELKDPTNQLYHRMPIRRMEAEAIRDTLLSLSGRLNPTIGGPSVAPHLTDFMVGRGRPSESGPLDGGGRRSIYLGVRRNFLNPWFLAFDYPTPFSCMGRRNVSNVPAQALAMLNNPFVIEQSQLWARRVIREAGNDPIQRLNRLYEMAFARLPTDQERADAQAFLAEQEPLYGKPQDPRSWEELAHVLVNTKSFIFIP